MFWSAIPSCLSQKFRKKAALETNNEREADKVCKAFRNFLMRDSLWIT